MWNIDVVIIDKPVEYKEALERQIKEHQRVVKGDVDGVLLILQHNPVITVGTSGGWDNLLVSTDELEAKGIDVYPVGRGGNITYHGPGQLTVYPIIDLKICSKDAHRYVRFLEEMLINVLSDFNLEGSQKAGLSGAWINDKKIAAIGVKIKRWVTYHGFSLNVDPNMRHFKYITPCGIEAFGVTSMIDEIGHTIEIERVIDSITHHFKEQFTLKIQRIIYESICGNTRRIIDYETSTMDQNASR